MFEEFKKNYNRYLVDYKEHDLLINPKQPSAKKYNFRINMNGSIYYFKGNGVFSYDIAELFCNQIAKQVGLKTIDPVPAYFVDEKGKYIDGILSKDYLENRKYTEVISGYKLLNVYENQLTNKEFNLNDFLKKPLDKDETTMLYHFNNIQAYKKSIISLQKAIKKINPNKRLQVEKNIINDLCKYLIFYFVTCNEDCYAHNVEFVLSKVDANTVKISLAPLTDNSISLLIKSFKFDHKNLPSQISDDKLEEIVKTVLEKIRIPFSVFEKESQNFRRESVAIEIAKLINGSPKLKDFYTKLKSIDLNELLNSYKQKNNYYFIDDLDIKVASIAYKNSVKQLDKGLDYCKLFFPSKKNVEPKDNFEKE